MTRFLYRCLLRMHPPAFRRFSAEMLSIFDAASEYTGRLNLLVDAFVSLIRQWILRSEGWKLAVAVAGACLQVALGGLIWLGFGSSGRPQPGRLPADGVAMDRLVHLIVIAGGGIFLSVTTLSLGLAAFARRRAQSHGVRR